MRDRVLVAAFAAGSAAGGLAVTSLVWLTSGIGDSLPRPVATATIAAAVLLAVLRDTGIMRLDLPQATRLVPRTILHKGFVLGAVQFGFELGVGIMTYLTSTLPYLMWLAIVVLAPSPAAALLAGVAFGLGRTLPLLLRLISRSGEAWDDRLAARRAVFGPVATFAAVPVLLVLAVTA